MSLIQKLINNSIATAFAIVIPTIIDYHMLYLSAVVAIQCYFVFTTFRLYHKFFDGIQFFILLFLLPTIP